MAASILSAQVRRPWDIWSTLITSDSLEQDRGLAGQVRDCLGMVLLLTPQTTEPFGDLTWEVGVTLCGSVASSQIPGARRAYCWIIPDVPSPLLNLEQRMLGYRRIRDALRAHIDEVLLLPSLRTSWA